MRTLIATIFSVAAGVAAAHADVSGSLDLILPHPQSVVRMGGTVAEDIVCGSPAVIRASVPGAPARTADESYRLDIGEKGAVITAPSDRGVRHARTTLHQLAKLSGGNLPRCSITDWPRFPLRGLMLDCGRNFQSLELLRALVDHLAMYKCNVFHWHLTDYYGWRLESKRHPILQSERAFGRQIGRYYTQKEFVDFLKYASERGVIVIPEFDVPGHTLAFRRAFGLERMNSPGVRETILDLIDELCSLAPPELMPYVHLGTDEVNHKLKGDIEGVPAEWLAAWAQKVSDNGRTLLGWMPGERLAPTGPTIHEYWWFTPSEFFRKFLPEAGSHAYIDSTDMCYINHVDPRALLAGAAYTQPCRWGTDESFRMGALISSWHDNIVAHETDMARTNPLFPSVVLFCDSFWRGRTKDEPGLLARIPPPSDPRFAAAADLERAVVAQRDRVLDGLKWPFPFVRQTQMRWRMTDAATGRVIARDIPQATVYPRHNIFPVNAYMPSCNGCVVLETWIRSPKSRQVGAWIGFTAFSRSGGRSFGAKVPDIGQWSPSGAKVEINGAPVPPPRWTHPGLTGGREVYEVPFTDEEWFCREPTPIALREGWNHVRLEVPAPKASHQKWVATFTPLLGTTAHPREVPGLEYADSAP